MTHVDAALFLVLTLSIINHINSCEVSVTTASGTHAPTGIYCSGQLIFEENFDKLDLRVWQHEVTMAGGGNQEFEWYTNNRSNSFAQDGILHIKPTFVADEFGNDFLYSGTLDINGDSPYVGCTNALNNGCLKKGTKDVIINPVKSARIRTVNSFAFKYGKIEVNAKIPAGDWLWPAIWMMPKWYVYSTWPASGEIDIMESRGNKQLFYWTGQNIGTHLVTSTLHYGPNYRHDPYTFSHFETTNNTGFDMDYHKYQMEWTPSYIKFSIDDKESGTVTPPDDGFWGLGKLNETGIENPWRFSESKMAPFDDEFHIIINLAVGGNTFPDVVAINVPGWKPWINNSPDAPKKFWEARDKWIPTWHLENDDYHFKIDYVKVWAL